MKKSLVLAVVTATLLSACATQQFSVSGNAGGSAKMEDSQTFFLSGIGQTQTVDAAKVCGGASKVRAVEVVANPLDLLLGAVTFGIYTPRTAKVYCN